MPEPKQSRWKGYLETLQARAEKAMAAAEARREHSRIYDTFFRVYERNRFLPASVLVGALASRIVIYVIPLLSLLIVGLGLYEDAGGAGTEAAGTITGLFADAVEDTRDVSNGFRFAALVATVFAVLWAANSLGRLLRRTIAFIWGIPYERSTRPWLTPLGVLGISVIGIVISGFGSFWEEWTWQLRVGVVVVESLFLVSLWLVVSRALPHHPKASHWTDFLPGALLLGFGIVGLRLAMVVYLVPRSAELAARYGTIGVALVMLTWAYWLGMVIIGGSELNAALFRSRQVCLASSTG